MTGNIAPKGFSEETMKEKRMRIKYRLGGRVYEDDLYQNEHYVIDEQAGDDGIKTVITPKEKLELISFSLSYNRKCVNEERFYANGYQSWTTSAEYTADDKQKGLPGFIKALPFAKKLATPSGDYLFTEYSKKRGNFHAFTYCYFRLDEEVELYGSLNESSGFTVFYVGMDEGSFVITKDVEGAELKAGESFELMNVTKIKGRYEEVFDEYFLRMGVPKPRIDHMAGYTSWYNYFANIDASTIRRDLDGLISATKGLQVAKDSEIFQIDDGWQTAVGDWEIDPVKFPKTEEKQDGLAAKKGGLAAIVDDVHAAGMKAGLWLAPFCVGSDAEVLRKNPGWILKTRKGGKKKAIAGFNGWGGPLDPFYAFDLENEEVRGHIKDVFKNVWEWGFDLVKLDFLYAACMFPRGGKTRGRLMHEAMKFLREECLDDNEINGGGQKLLLGCGVPIVSALGYVEACRIGCDVDLTYKPRFYGKCTNEEIVSAENAMNNTIWRSHLDGNFFLADPDVFFLRGEKAPERTDKAKEIAGKGKKYRAIGEGKGVIFTNGEKDMLRKINSTFGSVLFVSDNAGESGYDTKALREAYTENPRRDIKVIERTSRNVIEVTFGNGDKATADFAQGKFEIVMAAGDAKGASSEPASPETQKKA